MTIFKLRPTFIIVVVYLVVYLILRYNDSAMFTEINRQLGVKNMANFAKQLSKEQYAKSLNLPKEYRSRNANVILVWNSIFGEVVPAGFPDDGCVLTYDRTSLPFAKAVLFHFAETPDDPSGLPTKGRKEWQRWVWWCVEPPWNTRFVFQKTLVSMKNVFNWTMTYRDDSDIQTTYVAKPSRKWANMATADIMKQKTATSLGIWLVSNCNAQERWKFMNELKEYVDIDIRGKCTGKNLCRGQCELDTIATYKFYFSLENSRCQDYITEKFFANGLRSGAVPIVMGPKKDDYERLAPPNSFIHIDDFPSVKSLADYLLELDKDDDKYAEYLKWQSLPDYGNKHLQKLTLSSRFQKVCEMLKKEPPIHKTIPDLATWWYGKGYDASSKKFSVCHPEDGPSGLNLHQYFVAAYTASVLIFCIITIKLCQTKINRGKRKG